MKLICHKNKSKSYIYLKPNSNKSQGKHDKNEIDSTTTKKFVRRKELRMERKKKKRNRR